MRIVHTIGIVLIVGAYGLYVHGWKVAAQMLVAGIATHKVKLNAAIATMTINKTFVTYRLDPSVPTDTPQRVVPTMDAMRLTPNEHWREMMGQEGGGA